MIKIVIFLEKTNNNYTLMPFLLIQLFKHLTTKAKIPQNQFSHTSVLLTVILHLI